MACFMFTPHAGHTLADVLSLAHRLRLEAGDYAIGDQHLADPLAILSKRTEPARVPVPAS